MTQKAVKVAAATTNPQKIKAIREAFGKYFTNVEIYSAEVESGVPSQPINEDVFKGASNRIKAIKMVYGKEADFFTACEGGMICLYGNWFNHQVIIVEDSDGKKGIALSQGIQVPDKYVNEVIRTSFANVMDRIFNGRGGIRILTKGIMSRENLVEDGTVLALTRLLNGTEW